MNATTALAIAFLEGRVLSIRSAFVEFGITNLPREASRSIEQKFDVRLSRTRKEGKSRYGVPCYWFEYRLNNAPHNRPGRKKMRQYVFQELQKNTD